MRTPSALLVAGLVVGLGLLTQAAADELSGADQLRLLYSNQFTFTTKGMPVVPVQLMEGQREVTISARGALLVLPQGEGGPSVRGTPPWRVTLERAKPARVRYWTVVARVPVGRAREVRGHVDQWRGRKLSPRTFEVGTVFGVSGEVLDSREVLVTVAPQGSARAARSRADELRRRFRIETGIYEELVERPQGTLVATDARGTVVRSRALLWFVRADSGRILVHRVEHGVGFASHGFQDRTYFGAVYVTVDRTGRLAVVNAAPADKLLEGLVPAEIFPSAPPAALRAQAVAARGELLAKIGTRHLVDPYRLCSSQHCQVYRGAGHEHPRTSAAVAATRGKVLFVPGEARLVDTRYSAACGGFTEDNDAIWNMRPEQTLRGHLDADGPALKALARFARGLRTTEMVSQFLGSPAAAFCKVASVERGKRYRWRVRRSAAELSRLVAKHYPKVGQVRELRPLTRGLSGRIRALQVVGTRGQVTVRGDFHIRQVLGGLKSCMFVVTRQGSGPGASYVFTGGGWGHGVGMCQTGAIGMAERGYTYQQILRHYYTGSRLRKLY